MDIIIYTNPETLRHKQGKLENDEDYSETGDYYWQLPSLPKHAKEGDKVYFATKGFIRGFFTIKDLDDIDSIIFNCGSWRDISPKIPIKHFQGFKYAKNLHGL